jgi:predicted RNase H-like HicB family nuclease
MTDQTRNVDDLFKCLENLDIVLCEDDGEFTVFTRSEPFFCFTRKTREEINRVVVDTIKSYVETFYRVEDTELKTVEEPLKKETPIRRHVLKPISKLRPTFDIPASERRAYA